MVMKNINVIDTMTKLLLDKGYDNAIITMLGNGSYKLSITGKVHVQEIKDMFEVIKWEYDDDKVLFYI